jgi:multidrug efflux system outer membrane protein
MAQLYPDLMLTGTYGTTSDRWEDLWDRNFEVYSALTALSAPIWKGGQLRAQIRAAEARYAELAANYAGTVLQAMQEVEDALVGERFLQAQFEHAQLQLAEYEQAEQLSRRRYDAGVESLLTVLESERRRRIAEEQLTLLKGQIWTTRVNLHLALGGNWADSESAQEQVAKH